MKNSGRENLKIGVSSDLYCSHTGTGAIFERHGIFLDPGILDPRTVIKN